MNKKKPHAAVVPGTPSMTAVRTALTDGPDEQQRRQVPKPAGHAIWCQPEGKASEAQEASLTLFVLL